MSSIKDQKLLYHLTSLENLDSILSKGLCSRSNLSFSEFDNVAEQDIINFRQSVNINSYVPFHFFAHNPFDGRVLTDNSSKEFIYICVKRSYAKVNNFLIIPQHPKSMTFFQMYEFDEGFGTIDWDTMDKRNYSNDYCRHVCMAECVSPQKILPTHFSHIFVKTEYVKNIVHKKTIKKLGSIYPFYINVNSNMFVE